MYFIYHIPTKKIGVTRNINKRVTIAQGYKIGEFEVLEVHPIGRSEVGDDQ